MFRPSRLSFHPFNRSGYPALRRGSLRYRLWALLARFFGRR